MRRLGVVVAMVFLMSFVLAAGVSIEYGDYVAKSYELNDNLLLDVLITNIPAHVHGIFISLDPSLEGHVFCAPGKVSHDINEVWDAAFSCILLKGTYEGTLYFKPADIDLDENGDYLAQPRTTRLFLAVSEKEVWYTNYGYTSIGGTIAIGQYTLKVNDSDVVSADVEILKGSIPIFAGVLFLGQEVKVADDFYVVFNGYSEKRGMAFFTFKTKFLVSVSSSAKEYYLAVSPLFYADETNKARLAIYTNCSQVDVCDQNGECKTYDVPDTLRLELVVKVGDYEIKCKGTDLSQSVSVQPPLVITKVVEKKVEVRENPDDICPSWFFNLPDYRKSSLCGNIVATQPTERTNTQLFDWRVLALLILIGVGIWYYNKRRGKKGFEEPEKEIEAVPDVEG